MTEKHRKVLRQLLIVLEDLIDENEAKGDKVIKGISKLWCNKICDKIYQLNVCIPSKNIPKM